MKHGLPPRPPGDDAPFLRPLAFWVITLALFLLVSKCAHAQVPSGYQVVPDCQAAFFLTQANQVSAAINNTQVGCTSWAVQYSTVTLGPGPTLQLDFQSAIDAGGTPGVYGANVTVSGAINWREIY